MQMLPSSRHMLPVGGLARVRAVDRGCGGVELAALAMAKAVLELLPGTELAQ